MSSRVRGWRKLKFAYALFEVLGYFNPTRQHLLNSVRSFPDTMVCTGCCATLDHIVTYLLKQVTNKGVSDAHHTFTALICHVLPPIVGKKARGGTGATLPENDPLVAVIKMRPEILQQMLSTVIINYN